MKKLVTALLMIATTLPLYAQQGKSGYSGLSFITPLTINAGHDSNFLIDRTKPGERLFFLSLPPSVQFMAPNALPQRFDDQVLILGLPKTAFVSDSMRHQLTVSYQPEFEIFRGNRDQNSWNHEAGADFSYFPTRRTQISVGDNFRTSKDPSRVLQNVFLLLPRGGYKENTLRGSFNFNKSELTSFGIRADHTLTLFDQVDQFQRRVLNSTANSLSLVATRMLQRNHRLRGTYSVFQVTPINSQKTGDGEVDHESAGLEGPAQSVTLEYRFSPDPSTVFEFTGGGVHTGGGPRFIFGGLADRRIGSMWLGGGYSRTLSFFGGQNTTYSNGIAPAAFYEVVFLRFRGQVSRRIGLEISGVGSHEVHGSLIGQTKMGLGRSRIDYRLSNRTVVFFSAETYQQSRNEFINTPLSRNRFFTGIEISLSSEAQRRTSRLNRDADNVALTEQSSQRRQRPK